MLMQQSVETASQIMQLLWKQAAYAFARFSYCTSCCASTLPEEISMAMRKFKLHTTAEPGALPAGRKIVECVGCKSELFG